MSTSRQTATSAQSVPAEFSSDHYRMLILDLDGTALDRDRTLTGRDVMAAQALQEAGVHVTIATGRLYGGTAEHAQTLGVVGSIACMNGAENLDAKTGEVLSANYLPNDIALQAREALSQLDLATSLFSSWTIHHSPDSQRFKKYLRTWSSYFHEWSNVFDAPQWHEDKKLLAVVATGRMGAVREAEAALTPLLNPDLHEVLAFETTVDPDRGFFMLRDKREDKGTSLRRMADELGIDETQVVCVGDWMNDLPMLTTGALSFAMGGTPDWVQKAAKHVARTPTGQDGGVIAELAERVWGIRV